MIPDYLLIMLEIDVDNLRLLYSTREGYSHSILQKPHYKIICFL